LSHIIGVDIGGTFTDCVLIDPEGTVTIAKAPSTPPDFERGFIDAIAAAASQAGTDPRTLIGECEGIYHGCTIGTNALVEGKGATVGLLVTRGHRDSIFFMQSGRRMRTMPPEYIASIARHRKPEPLVPKSLVGEIDERVGVDGGVIAGLDEDGARRTIEAQLQQGVSAFAVSLLWSVANDGHEQRVAEIVRELAPEAFVSVAAEVVPRIGEYERTVATVINSARWSARSWTATWARSRSCSPASATSGRCR
jgi:N-methylhydantoinase A